MGAHDRQRGKIAVAPTRGHGENGNGGGNGAAPQVALKSVPQATAAYTLGTSPVETVRDIKSRTMYVPRMPYGGTRMLAAAFKSIGLDARPVPDEDARTLELGAKYTSGDECYPQRIVLGGFLKLLEDHKVDPGKTALLLPTANGPCRFGQYFGLLRQVLDERGLEDVIVLPITSADGYAGIGEQAGSLIRTAWRAVVIQDILLKLLLMTRPYEVVPGETDKVYMESLELMGDIIGRQGISNKERLADARAGLARAKTMFAEIAVKNEDRPLIGVVGEIFCRLNTFANNEVIRHIEAQGGECWLAGVGEWVWYTNSEAFRRLREEKRRVSRDWLRNFLTARVMKKDEEALIGDFHEIFRGYRDPHVDEVLGYSHPYLPREGALGEMVLSTGGTIYLYHQGVDGIVDISPFTCMNGIVTEAIYPRVSREHDNIPIRVFYFDGTASDLDRDVGIFLELAKTYKRRKKIPRG